MKLLQKLKTMKLLEILKIMIILVTKRQLVKLKFYLAVLIYWLRQQIFTIRVQFKTAFSWSFWLTGSCGTRLCWYNYLPQNKDEKTLAKIISADFLCENQSLLHLDLFLWKTESNKRRYRPFQLIYRAQSKSSQNQCNNLLGNCKY